MEFNVEFYAKQRPLAKRKCECNGIRDLDMVRKQFKIPKLPPECIHYGCFYESGSKDVKLTEDQARRSLVFYETCDLKVEVKTGGFNRYLRRIVEERKPDKCDKRGFFSLRPKYPQVVIRFELDTDQLIEDWLEHGCPLRWDPDALGGVYPETDDDIKSDCTEE